MARLIPWKDRTKVKQLLARRLKAAKAHRRNTVEDEWRLCRNTVLGTAEDNSFLAQYAEGTDTEDFDITERLDILYAMRNVRLIHSHMSSNPPVATARAQSSDIEDRRAAKSAQHAMRWFLQTLDIHDTDDLVYLDCIITGTGISRTGFNPDSGEPTGYNEETCEMQTEGAIELERVPVDYFWPNPESHRDSEMRHTFELRLFTEEECQSYWYDKWPIIKKRGRYTGPNSPVGSTEVDAPLTNSDTDGSESEPRYALFWYYEPGLPENGFLGRFCICLEDGTLITDPDVNPNQSFPPPPLDERRKAVLEGRELEKGLPTAYLPYQLVTDIDVPDRLWGRSSIFYAAPAQRVMSNIDSAMLEAVKAHGVVRLLLPSGAKMGKDAISNTSVEILSVEEDPENPDQNIQFMAPPGLPTSMTELRGSTRTGVDEMMGINENMFGQQSREQSAVNMQYAVNQGAMVRRRLFNKSVRFVRNQYKALLSLAVQHWDVKKSLAVLGEEKAYDVVELLGMDLYAGYEIDVEYGTHLPLDPMARRDELLKYFPMYQAAGMSQKSLISAIGMADLEYVQSLPDLVRDRAQEIVDTIIATGEQVDPASKFQDHAGIVAFLMEYVNTADFDRLPADRRMIIDEQIQMRIQLAAEQAQAGAPPAGNATPAAAPPLGGPPGSVPPAAPAPQSGAVSAPQAPASNV